MPQPCTPTYHAATLHLSPRLHSQVRELPLDDESRARVIGFPPGTYVRIVLDEIPMEFVEHFDPTTPLIAGGLLPGEARTISSPNSVEACRQRVLLVREPRHSVVLRRQRSRRLWHE